MSTDEEMGLWDKRAMQVEAQAQKVDTALCGVQFVANTLARPTDIGQRLDFIDMKRNVVSLEITPRAAEAALEIEKRERMNRAIYEAEALRDIVSTVLKELRTEADEWNGTG